ncbi:MAG: hypothetical protein SPL80_09835 [Bacilli bacterium]|nr:hypothetical protein [Bacilli bacterium]
MDTKKRNFREQLLLQTLTLYRYEEEVRILELEEADASAKQAKPDKTFAQAVSSLAEKLLKTKEDHAKILQKAQQNRDEFKKTIHEEADLTVLEDEGKLTDYVNAFFERDNLSRRLAFALDLGLEEANDAYPKFLRPDASRKAVSKILFNDEEKLGKIMEVFAYSYSRLAGIKTKPNSDKAIALGTKLGSIGAGMAALGIFTGVGLLLGTAIGLSGLALYTYGKNQKKREEASSDESLMLFSSFIYNGDVRKGIFGRSAAKKLKQMGAAIDAKGHVFALSSAITLYNFRFVDKNSDLAKESLSLLLENIDDLRADAEYKAIVEREELEENRKKMLAAERATTLLYELVRNDEKHYEAEEIEIIEVIDPKRA